MSGSSSATLEYSDSPLTMCLVQNLSVIYCHVSQSNIKRSQIVHYELFPLVVEANDMAEKSFISLLNKIEAIPISQFNIFSR